LPAHLVDGVLGGRRAERGAAADGSARRSGTRARAHPESHAGAAGSSTPAPVLVLGRSAAADVRA